MRKEFVLSESDMKILKLVMEQNQFDKEVDAVRFLIHNYDKNKTENQLEELNRQFKILMEIIKSIDQDNTLMLDAVNTFLISSDMKTCIPAALSESPVYSKSKEYRNKLLIERKQIKDYKSLK